MTEQETINNELQMKLALQDAKFNQFMNEMKDFRNETREQNKMRADEISEIRNDIKEIHKTTDAKLAALSAATDAKVGKIENKIDSMVKHIQILSLTAMGGIIAAGVGIAAMVWSVMNK